MENVILIRYIEEIPSSTNPIRVSGNLIQKYIYSMNEGRRVLFRNDKGYTYDVIVITRMSRFGTVGYYLTIRFKRKNKWTGNLTAQRVYEYELLKKIDYILKKGYKTVAEEEGKVTDDTEIRIHGEVLNPWRLVPIPTYDWEIPEDPRLVNDNDIVAEITPTSINTGALSYHRISNLGNLKPTEEKIFLRYRIHPSEVKVGNKYKLSIPKRKRENEIVWKYIRNTSVINCFTEQITEADGFTIEIIVPGFGNEPVGKFQNKLITIPLVLLEPLDNTEYISTLKERVQRHTCLNLTEEELFLIGPLL